MLAISSELALSAAARASCLALGIGLLEQLAILPRAFAPRGPYSLEVTAIMGAPEWARRIPARAFRFSLILGVLAATVGACLGPFVTSGKCAMAVLLAGAVLSKLRRIMGGDGAEQMSLLVLFVSCLVSGQEPGGLARNAAVWFIAGQGILSYFTAGIAKLVSPIWRSGASVPLILGSAAYGHPRAAATIRSIPKAGFVLTWLVIVFEVAFPLVLLGPPALLVLLFAAGFAFHAGCAVIMGLNTFVFAFPGTYLCIAYVVARTSPFW